MCEPFHRFDDSRPSDRARDPDQAGLPRKWAERLSAGSNKLADLIDTTQGELRKREGEAPKRVLLYLDQGEELSLPKTRSI
jgi:hypothetical protein